MCSITVSEELFVTAYTQSFEISQHHFQHLLNKGHLNSATSLLNIIASCKALVCDDDGIMENQMRFNIEVAICSLKQYLSKSTANLVDDTPKLQLIEFVIEQLQLLQLPQQARRYSSNTITTAFLWQLTSCSLYKKLRELFVLPSLSRLRSYSSCLTVEARSLDLTYLKHRIDHLEKKERMVTLMIDEVYTAKRIEYSNGAFIGLTKDGNPARTVLAFMVQSTCSKFKDVVCLIPVQKLDTTQLRFWFDKVVSALHDILFIVAVSVDNHICNR